jgi:hypothetical protein
MERRRSSGSFIAENTAVLVIIILGMTFPLINLATSTYRYNMICGAAKAGAHSGATASTFTNVTTGAAALIPATINNYLGQARGIHNVTMNWRINQSSIATQAVTLGSWKTKLAANADPSKFIYSIEVVIDADVDPLVTMAGSGIVPNVPGLTGQTHQSSAAQEVVETITGLNQ